MENNRYYSYVMGISDEIIKLNVEGFSIDKNGDNYEISFPLDKADLWEEFVVKNLENGFWNEYLNNKKEVFIFKFEDGSVKKYVLDDSNHDEILSLCCKFAECEFKSIKEMLLGNEFYREKIN